MKKKRLILYYSILFMFCQGLTGVSAAFGLTEAQKDATIDHCAAIKADLRTIQRNDARARVYLGGRYETILMKFVTPLNVRLVENNLSSGSLVEAQNNLALAKNKFTDDYVEYQQRLEELVAVDCKADPEGFYEKLERVRRRRNTMEQDMVKIDGILSNYLELVKGVKGGLSGKE